MNDGWKDLYSAVMEKKEQPVEESYTCYLFERGMDKVLKKIGEDCAETIIVSKNGSKAEMVYEISDLIYHLTVLMAQQDISLEMVSGELERRAQKINACKPAVSAK